MKRHKEHKVNYDALNNADTIWSRLSAKRKASTDKSAQQKLGIVDLGHEPPGGRPMKMMDIIMSMYENGEEYEEEDGSSE